MPLLARAAATLAVVALALSPARAQTTPSVPGPSDRAEAAPPALAVISAGQAGATVFAGGMSQPGFVVQLAGSGTVLVTDAAAGTVASYQADGTRNADFATGLADPAGITQLDDGTVLIVEGSVGRIAKYHPDGTSLGDFATGLSSPFEAVQIDDGAGNRPVLVTVADDGRVARFLADGTPDGDFATGLLTPVGITQLADGRVLVAASPDRVASFQANGTPNLDFATGLGFPYSVAQLADGTVLVTEPLTSRVVSFGVNGTGRTVYRSALAFPVGLLQFADGTVLVCEPFRGSVAALSGAAEGYYQVAAPGTAETIGGGSGGVLGPLWTQGYTGADDTGGAPSVLLYSEPVDGDLNDGYDIPASASDPFPAGTSAYVYVYADTDLDGVDEDAPFALPLASAEPALPFAFPITYSDNADGGADVGDDTDDDGWNLLGNPVRERLDWNATWDAATTANVDPTAYAYDPVANEYSTYNAQTDFGTGSMIADGFILQGQGFYVRANGASPALVAPSGASSARRRGSAAAAPHVRLRVTATGTDDPGRRVASEMAVALAEGAALARDGFDAVYLGGIGEPVVGLAGLAEGSDEPLAHAVLPAAEALGAGAEVALALGAAGVADARLTWDLALPDGWTATLVDRRTGAAHLLAPSDPAGPFGGRRPSIALDVSGAGAEPEPGRYALRLAPGTPVAGADGPSPVAEVSAPWPNPAPRGATVAVTVPSPERVRVVVYDALGREVAVAHDGAVAGRAEVSVGRGLAAGVYVVRVVGASFAESRTLTVLR